MEKFDSVVLVCTVVIIGIYHVLHLLETLFGAPEFLVKYVRKRRSADVKEVLSELGITAADRATIRQATFGRRVRELSRYNNPEERLLNILRSCTDAGQFPVGATEPVAFPYFTDVMTASLKEGRADEFASILISFIKKAPTADQQIDYVVGLKQGAPLVALSLGNKLRVPVALFRGHDEYKWGAAAKPPEALFDGMLEGGKKAVIVDDSTTGGRSVLDCATTLRKLNVTVTQCWVLFEPIGKNAREKLHENGIELLSVVKMTPDVINKLT